MTPLNLTRLSPVSRRLLVASCAADPRVDVPPAQRQALWERLGDHTWAPTLDDSPLPLATVDAWLRQSQGALWQWLETALLEET